MKTKYLALILSSLLFAQSASTALAQTPLEQYNSSEGARVSGKNIGEISSPKPASEVHDYLEPVNRVIFRFNEIVDGVLIKPLTHIYRGVVPEIAQKGVKNALTNLSAPVVLLNSALQWDGTNAGRTASRFVINSTLGVLGLFDVASEFGIPKEHRKDFGQTMGVYGTEPGTYIVIPILGPSDLRDLFGLGVDIASDPFTYIFTTPESFARAGLNGINTRSDLLKFTDKVYKDSLDPYATFRSVYLQNRKNMINNYHQN